MNPNFLTMTPPVYRVVCRFAKGVWRVAACTPPHPSDPCTRAVRRTWDRVGVLSHTPRQVGKMVNPLKLLKRWQRAQKVGN